MRGVSERTSEWPSTFIWVLNYSGPQCRGSDADQRSEMPIRDSALGDSNPEIDAGNSVATTTMAMTTTTPSKTGVVKAAFGKLNIFDRLGHKKTESLLPLAPAETPTAPP